MSTTKSQTETSTPETPLWVIKSSAGGFELQQISSAVDIRTFPTLDTAIRRGADEAEAAGGTLLVYGLGGGLADKITFASEPVSKLGTPDTISCEVSRTETGWAVRPNGPSDDQVEFFVTKKDAMEHATAMAEERGAPLVVYYTAGHIDRIVTH